MCENNGIVEQKKALCEKEADKCADFAVDKIIGVGLIGAVAAIAAYYVYCSVSNEARQNVKTSVSSFFRSQIYKFYQSMQDIPDKI